MRAPLLTFLSLLLLLFLFAPLAVAVLFAFSAKPILTWPFEGWSLQWFEALFSERAFRRAFATSFQAACWTAVISTLIGTMASFVFTRRRSALSRAVLALSRLPVMLPGLFLGVGFIAFMVAVGTGPGMVMIVAGHTVVSLPWVVLVMTSRLRTYDVDLEAAARDLGAGPVQVLLRVTIPIIAPALVGSALLAFAWSFDETLVTVFTAGQETTVPLYIISRLRRVVDPGGNAVAALLLLIPWITFAFAVVALRRSGGIGSVLGLGQQR
jgi:ABC-type spermidine/putrescine transport system permease subunit II